ncbi:MAG: AI-2E family transporter [Pseudonocardiaceae bacterium]
MSDSPRRRDAVEAVPYPLRVAAAVSWRFLAVSGLFVVLGYVAIKLRIVVVPVAVALLLTALLGPVVTWLSQRGVRRGLATAVVMVSGLALISGLLAFVIQAFVSGLPDLRTQVVDSVRQIRNWLEDPPFGLPPVNAENLLNSVGQAISGSGGSITAGAVSTAVGVGEFLAGIALVLFTLIYFLYGGRAMWQYLLGLVPGSVRSRVDVAGHRAFASLVGFVRAAVLVAVVDAIGIGIGLIAVGAPLVVPLMALIFLASFVPVVGAVVSGVVAVLIVLVSNGLVAALVVLGVVLGVQQLEGNVLQPLLLGRAVELNGMAVVLAVAIGSVAAGITGALLAVPLLAVLNAGIRSLVNGDSETSEDGGTNGNGDTRKIRRKRRPNGSADGRWPHGSALPPADVPLDPAPDPLFGSSVDTEDELSDK